MTCLYLLLMMALPAAAYQIALRPAAAATHPPTPAFAAASPASGVGALFCDGGVRRAVVAPAMNFAAFEFPATDEDEEDDDDYDDAMGGATGPVVSSSTIKITDQPAVNLTTTELQQALKKCGQKSTGTKKDLVTRVQLLQRKQLLGIPLNEVEVLKQRQMEWYMLQTANGFERSVERNPNMMIKTSRLQDKIDKVWVPILEGETSVREASVMPSYIFVRMKMDQKMHFLVSDMQYVINFVGADRGGRSMSGNMVGNRGFVRPMPITDEALENIVKLTQAKRRAREEGGDEGDGAADGAGAAAATAAFAVDDVVEVEEGAFKGMRGPVIERAHGRGDEGPTLTLVLTVMGRDTPVTVPEGHCSLVEKAAL